MGDNDFGRGPKVEKSKVEKLNFGNMSKVFPSPRKFLGIPQVQFFVKSDCQLL